MIFEALNDALARGELILADGLMCRYHLRRDRVLTILEILAVPERRREGRARAVLHRLRMAYRAAADRIRAKCPADLVEGNAFWQAMGFVLVRTEPGKRPVNVWEWEWPADRT